MFSVGANNCSEGAHAMTKAISTTLLGVFLSFIVASCSTATIKSTPIDSDELATVAEEGLLYALPKRMLRLTVSGAPKSTKIQEELAKAKKDMEDARKTESQAKATVKSLEEELETLKKEGATDRIIEDRIAAIALAKVALQKTENAAVSATDKYLKLLAQAQEPDDARVSMSVSLEALKPIPDPKQWYVARIHPSKTRDDTWDLDTTELGLLSNGASTSTDRLADILVDLAGLAGIAAAEPLLVPGEELGVMEQAEKDPCNLRLPFSWQYEFDPIQGVGGINEALTACNLPFQLRADAIPATTSSNKNGTDDRTPLKGLVYRRPIPFVIDIRAKGSGEQHRTVRSTVVMLPQGGPVATVPYNAEPLVASVTNTTFVDGQPTKWHSEKPSEVAAAFRIPVSMAKALVQIPAELIKLRVDYSSSEVELIKAQTAYLCALEALQKAEGKTTAGFCGETESPE